MRVLSGTMEHQDLPSLDVKKSSPNNLGETVNQRLDLNLVPSFKTE